MDFVLIYLLILDFLSTGQSKNLVASDTCYEICEPGHYSVGQCSHQVKWHKCQRCPDDTFTDINNTATQCQRCDTCNNDEKIVTSCSHTRDVVCDCKDGHYNVNSNPNDRRDCQRCPCPNCDERGNGGLKKKCPPCKQEALSEYDKETQTLL